MAKATGIGQESPGSADGSTVTGLPTRIAGKDNNGDTQDVLVDLDGFFAFSSSAGADSVSNGNVIRYRNQNSGAGVFETGDWIYNGATWDRQRSNVNATLLASAARTASADSGDIVNYNGRGIQVVVDVTVDPASASFTTQIQVKDISSGKYITVLTSVAINGVGTTRLTVYPGITVAANVSASDLISRTWKVTTTHVDGDSITYSIGASIIL